MGLLYQSEWDKARVQSGFIRGLSYVINLTRELPSAPAETYEASPEDDPAYRASKRKKH